MLKKIKRAFGFGSCDPMEGSTIIINAEKLERRVALLENGVLEEYTIEREGEDNIVGGIFKGRVKNIEPGLKAMFVDIGQEKNAFLHFWDALPAALDSSLEEIEREGRPKKQQRKITSKDIPDIYPIGSEIMVQVTKGPIGTKGPRVTTNVSLAGRYLVLMPFTDQFGISRKIEDPKERLRLRQIMQKLNVPDGMGIIMRTVAQGQRYRHFVRDLAMLLEQWYSVEEKKEANPDPVCVYKEPDLIERTARDFLTDTVDNIISESSQMMLSTAIDVNTGRNKGTKDLDKTILDTNLEAAYEIARQLRLRNIGGLVVVDFIDMRHRKDQQAVYKAMKERLKRDKAKTQVLQITPIGLMEMTRQRLNESLRESVHDPCSYCSGRGRIKSVMTMSVEIQRQIYACIQKYRDTIGDMVIVVNSEVLSRFKNEDSSLLMELERQHSGRLIFRGDHNQHRESFAIYDARYDNKPLYQSGQ